MPNLDCCSDSQRLGLQTPDPNSEACILEKTRADEVGPLRPAQLCVGDDGRAMKKRILDDEQLAELDSIS